MVPVDPPLLLDTLSPLLSSGSPLSTLESRTVRRLSSAVFGCSSTISRAISIAHQLWVASYHNRVHLCYFRVHPHHSRVVFKLPLLLRVPIVSRIHHRRIHRLRLPTQPPASQTASLFPATGPAPTTHAQPKLKQDPNERTAACMRILINAVNSLLFPDADPDSSAWTRPPPNIVAVQSLLYAGLTTSLFAAFLAMLGKR